MAENSSRCWKILAALTCAGAMGGCSVTVPVAVVANSGEIMRGNATASWIEGGSFQASNERASCAGTYDANPAATVSFAVRCTDGRTGVGQALRDNPTSGSGTIQMSDGTTARFVFGPAAKAF